MTVDHSRPAAHSESPGGGPPDAQPASLPRKLLSFGLFLAALWVAIAAFVFHTNQDETVLTSDWQKSVKSSVQTVLPEQWGFFTRSPREDELLPFAQDASGSWASISQYPHSRADHTFGWNRESRAQGIEIGIIFAEVADAEWSPCTTQDPIDCLSQSPAQNAENRVKVNNPSPDPTMCGRVAISKALPPPWAWANIGQPFQEFSVIVVDATC